MFIKIEVPYKSVLTVCVQFPDYCPLTLKIIKNCCKILCVTKMYKS